MRCIASGDGNTQKLAYPERAFDSARRIGPDIFVSLSGGDPASQRHALFLPPSLSWNDRPPLRLPRARSLLHTVLDHSGPFVANDLVRPEFEEESEFRKHGICSYVAIKFDSPGGARSALVFASRAVRRFDALAIGTLLDHVDGWSRGDPTENEAGDSATPRDFDDQAVIGESPEFLEVCRLIAQVSRIDSTVLIRGESGTGKKRLARTIHRYSSRSARPFTRIDGSSLGDAFRRMERQRGASAEDAIEDDLSGALNGGTLLVDEIANLSAPDQATLLRLLQENESPSAASSAFPRNVRIIATTSMDLGAVMSRSGFRQDLYYRLAVIPITVPPLRGRPRDILPLAGHFLAESAMRLERPPMKLTEEARELLMNYDWPGNSRELSNAIEYAVLVTRGNEIRAGDLPTSVRQPMDSGLSGEGMSLRERLLRFEQEVIADAVRRSAGDRREVARILGIDPRNVSYFLKKHGIR
jgi:DNA-binding NtrC family response regulator